MIGHQPESKLSSWSERSIGIKRQVRRKKEGSSQVDYTDVQKLAGGSMQKGVSTFGQFLKKNNVSVSVNDKKVQPAVMANKLSNYM